MTRALRLLLLQENAAEAALVEEKLDRAGIKVTTQLVESIEEFSTAVQTFAPDVVISDHSFEQVDAAAAWRTLQAVRPAAPLIIVSAAFDAQTVVVYLRAGVEDIVPKVHLGRLGRAIEAALLVRDRLERLSPRQVEVLRLIAEGHTTRAIAQRLSISVKTVDPPRGELMRRLGIYGLAGLVRYAIRVGLVLPGS
jgi:DNA-binding NarL/FixJ family response regulator